MLRVITVKRGGVYRLELHGILGGEWVPLLEQHWRSIVDGGASARVMVVVSNVDFIDPDGERLLRRMADAGARFVASGCMNRYLVGRLQANARTTKGSPHERAPRRPLRGSTGEDASKKDIAAMKADLAQLKAQASKARADLRAKLQSKIDQLKKKIDAQQHDAKERRDAFRARQRAKRDILKKNAATAGRALKDLASTPV